MAKPTSKQIKKVRSLMRQMGIPADMAHARVSEYITSGAWDREVVRDVVIPVLERKVKTMRYLDDDDRRSHLLSRIREDIGNTTKAVFGRDIMDIYDEEIQKARAIEVERS